MSIKDHPIYVPVTSEQLGKLLLRLAEMYNGKCEGVKLSRPEYLEPDIIIHIVEEEQQS